MKLGIWFVLVFNALCANAAAVKVGKPVAVVNQEMELNVTLDMCYAPSADYCVVDLGKELNLPKGGRILLAESQDSRVNALVSQNMNNINPKFDRLSLLPRNGENIAEVIRQGLTVKMTYQGPEVGP